MSGDIKYFFSPFARMFQNNLLNDLSVSALTIIIAYRRCMNQSALPCGGKKKRWRRKWSREHTEKPSCNTKMVRRRWSLRWVCQSDLAIHIPQYFSLPVTSWENLVLQPEMSISLQQIVNTDNLETDIVSLTSGSFYVLADLCEGPLRPAGLNTAVLTSIQIYPQNNQTAFKILQQYSWCTISLFRNYTWNIYYIYF